MNKSSTTLYLPKNGGEVNSILHCTDWNFSSSNCNSWEVNETSDYDYRETPNYMIFNVTGFDAFGGGQSSAQPNVTDIRVYDVSNTSNEETGGKLVDSGLNSTLNLTLRDNRKYRFEFKMVNDGLLNWEIQDQDELFHDGLNATWSFDRAWYNISQDYDGGSFTNGKVTWDTSQGGTLIPDETMYAKYLINVTPNKTEKYGLRFEANDTSENSGSFDQHTLNVTKLGKLNSSLSTPPSGTTTTVCRYEEFNVNATVGCENGVCGDVKGSLRYNSSNTVDTLMPENSGTPFHTVGSNLKIAENNMDRDQAVNISWTVNATGEIGKTYLIDANFSSNYNKISPNNTEDAELFSAESLRADFTQNKVDFGVLDPGTNDNPAVGNSDNRYNVTIRSCGSNVNVYTSSTNLTPEGWGKQNYSIEAENVSYSTQNDISSETKYSTDYSLLESGVSSGTNLTTFYWIDIPEGIKSSEYKGTISYKINLTG